MDPALEDIAAPQDTATTTPNGNNQTATETETETENGVMTRSEEDTTAITEEVR